MAFTIKSEKPKTEGTKKYRVIDKDGKELVLELTSKERNDFFLQGIKVEEVKDKYAVPPSEKENMPSPMFPIDDEHYPDKERLSKAIKKTNILFDKNDMDEILDRMDVTDFTLYWKEEGEGYDMRKLYGYHLEKSYLDPRTEEEKEAEEFGI